MENNDSALVLTLNHDCHKAVIDQEALEVALHVQGETFFRWVTEHCPHVFAEAAYFVSSGQMASMRAIIEAVERVVHLPGWDAGRREADNLCEESRAAGVFFGYDFHLDDNGAHLIEINTNAGGAFLSALLLNSQRHITLPGEGWEGADLERECIDMFFNEWRNEHPFALLETIAIVDEAPQSQYLYPEFILAQHMLKRAGVQALICDPSELILRDDGLYSGNLKIDLIYNRLTDFSLANCPDLLAAFRNRQVVLTPNPVHYRRYADKRNLVRLTDADGLQAIGANADDINVLLAGIPVSREVQADAADYWWTERKQWFFKPVSGFGGKGTYRGAGVTHRVFDEIVTGGYIAQKLVPPAERILCLDGDEQISLKSDVRCFVYDGKLQFAVARLYQGQITNFRTVGGGFAQIRVVG